MRTNVPGKRAKEERLPHDRRGRGGITLLAFAGLPVVVIADSPFYFL